MSTKGTKEYQFRSKALDEAKAHKKAKEAADVKTRAEMAYKQAVDTRKFEIELYWKRAAYFWTFIAAALTGWVAVRGATLKEEDVRQELLIVLSCVGLVFACAWFLVNKGSKFWQENWEAHVAIREDDFTGSLFKDIVALRREKGEPELTSYSVSRINRLLSQIVIGLWGLLLLHSLFPAGATTFSGRYAAIVVATIAAIVVLFKQGKSKNEKARPVNLKDPSTWKIEP
ncbi:hypothetical protein [Rhizobacter sp. Root1221]|uniref:RipA family octameric membrane protein n=1 Tax=Rhizobacter sp. Root1221 TaxID=1736433 RepID=UPI0007144576|nr:hypothetical protein [Rhizobacter sp. Root1221]KQV83114.1 hypothetical protein ASC87_09310 [Rhizobacter sp. Root1221]